MIYYLDPMEMIRKWWPDADISHIKYVPDLAPESRQYWRKVGATHDGTLYLTNQLFQKCLLPLLNKNSCAIELMKNESRKPVDIRYQIGKMIHTIDDDIKHEKEFDGIHEEMKIPVISKLYFE